MKIVIRTYLLIALLVINIGVANSANTTVYRNNGNTIMNGIKIIPIWTLVINENGDVVWGYNGFKAPSLQGRIAMGAPIKGPHSTFPYPGYKYWIALFDKVLEWQKQSIDKKMTVEKEMPELWQGISTIFVSEEEGKEVYIKVVNSEWGKDIKVNEPANMKIPANEIKSIKKKMLDQIQVIEKESKRIGGMKEKSKDASKLLK